MLLSLSSGTGTFLHAPPMPAPDQTLGVEKGLPSMFGGKMGRLKGSWGGGQKGKDEPAGRTKSIKN